MKALGIALYCAAWVGTCYGLIKFHQVIAVVGTELDRMDQEQRNRLWRIWQLSLPPETPLNAPESILERFDVPVGSL